MVFSTVKTFGESSGEDLPEEMRKLALQPKRGKNTSFLQIWNLYILATWKKQQGL